VYAHRRERTSRAQEQIAENGASAPANVLDLDSGQPFSHHSTKIAVAIAFRTNRRVLSREVLLISSSTISKFAFSVDNKTAYGPRKK
jgi:hypothetical protein